MNSERKLYSNEIQYKTEYDFAAYFLNKVFKKLLEFLGNIQARVE